MSFRMISERPSSNSREPGDLDDRIGEKVILRSTEATAGGPVPTSGGKPGGGEPAPLAGTPFCSGAAGNEAMPPRSPSGGGGTAPPAGTCGPNMAHRSKADPAEFAIVRTIGRGNGEPNPTADNLEFGG